MAAASATQTGSFIPKRNPRKSRSGGRKKFVVFTIVAYVAFLSAALSAVVVFFYQNYEESRLQQEVTDLNTAVATFKDTDLARVQQVDTQLQATTERLQVAASVVKIFEALDAATVQPVQLRSLTIDRINDESFRVTADIITSSLDAAVLQGQLYAVNQRLFSRAVTQDVSFAQTFALNEFTSVPETEITFTMMLDIPLEAVRYTPVANTIGV